MSWKQASAPTGSEKPSRRIATCNRSGINASVCWFQLCKFQTTSWGQWVQSFFPREADIHGSEPFLHVKVRITTHFQKGHGPPTRPAKMLIFKLTVLESLVLLLNSPGHLRVGMTSAPQAGVLELIFKKKSRGLRVVKKKAAQTIGRTERFAENKRRLMWDRTSQRKQLWGGVGWTLADEEHLGHGE